MLLTGHHPCYSYSIIHHHSTILTYACRPKANFACPPFALALALPLAAPLPPPPGGRPLPLLGFGATGVLFAETAAPAPEATAPLSLRFSCRISLERSMAKWKSSCSGFSPQGRCTLHRVQKKVSSVFCCRGGLYGGEGSVTN
jgi:hypothetical protein